MGHQRMDSGVDTHSSHHHDQTAATDSPEASERRREAGSPESGNSSHWPLRVPRGVRTSRFRCRGTAWGHNTLKNLGIQLGPEGPRKEHGGKSAAQEGPSPHSASSDEDGASSAGPAGPVLKTVQQAAGGRALKAQCTRKKRRGKRKERLCEEPVEETTGAAPSDFSTFASVMTALDVGEASQEPHRLPSKSRGRALEGHLPGSASTWIAGNGRSLGRAGSPGTTDLVVSGTNSAQAPIDHDCRSVKRVAHCDTAIQSDRVCGTSISKESDGSIHEKDSKPAQTNKTDKPDVTESHDNIRNANNSIGEPASNAQGVECVSDGAQTLGPQFNQIGLAVSGSKDLKQLRKQHSPTVFNQDKQEMCEPIDADERNRQTQQWQVKSCEIVGNQECERHLPNSHLPDAIPEGCNPKMGESSDDRVDGTPNTVSDVQQSATASVGQAFSGGAAPCQNRPPQMNQNAAPIALDPESKCKKIVHNGSTVRRIPQGDGLGPLKPWPSFDYGMSGEEYLTLFHQRNVRLHALQSDDGFDSNHPIEIDMDDSLMPENPFMAMDWHQRDMMGFPTGCMGYFGMRPPMMLPMMMRGMDGLVDYMGMPFGFMNQWRRDPDVCQQVPGADRNAYMRDKGTQQQAKSEGAKKEHAPCSRQPEMEMDQDIPATAKREGGENSPPEKDPHEENASVSVKSGVPPTQPMRKPMFPIPPRPVAGFGAPFPGPPFHRVPQGPTIPDFLGHSVEGTSKLGSQSEHTNAMFGLASTTVQPEKSSPTPPVNPSAWVANMMGQVMAGVENQNNGASKGETDGVVFFHNSSFEPVDPPWKSKLAMEVDMEVSEDPFPDDSNFSMACFDSLDQIDQEEEQETVLTQAPAADFGANVAGEPGIVLLSDGEETRAVHGFGVRGRRSGRGGRGGRRRNGCVHGQIHPCPTPLSASNIQRTKTKRKTRPKGKDGRPRIYPRIPKMTSLLPACINGGLHKVILEDLESHVKDYVDDSDALDRLVQDIESYLALLQRRERNGQKADWCEGCIEVILRGLQNSRVDPEEAKESGLLDTMQKITKHKNSRISRAARRALKEDWAVLATSIPNSEVGTSPTTEANKRSTKPSTE